MGNNGSWMVFLMVNIDIEDPYCFFFLHEILSYMARRLALRPSKCWRWGVELWKKWSRVSRPNSQNACQNKCQNIYIYTRNICQDVYIYILYMYTPENMPEYMSDRTCQNVWLVSESIFEPLLKNHHGTSLPRSATKSSTFYPSFCWVCWPCS